jgi:Protein of unknown function (DUF3435)
MTLTRDPRAPIKLSDAQKEELDQDPQLVALAREKRALGAHIEFQFGSILKANGTRLHEQYKKLDKAIKNMTTSY